MNPGKTSSVTTTIAAAASAAAATTTTTTIIIITDPLTNGNQRPGFPEIGQNFLDNKDFWLFWSTFSVFF